MAGASSSLRKNERRKELTITSRLAFEAEVAFESEINDTPAWQSITPWVAGFETKRGRSFELDNFETGTASLTLDNADDRFSPVIINKVYFDPGNLYPKQSLGSPYSVPGASYFPLSMLTVSAGNSTLSLSTSADTYTGCARIAVPILGAWKDLLTFPEVPVTEGRELQIGYDVRRASSAQPNVTLGLFVVFKGSDGWGNYYAHNVSPITVTTLDGTGTDTQLYFKGIVPPGATSCQVRITLRANTTAPTAFLVTAAFAKQVNPYMSPYDLSGRNYSYVRPNKRVRVNSVIGNNIAPRWAASPDMSGTYVGGFNGEAYQVATGSNGKIPPAEKWDSPVNGSTPTRYWGLGFIKDSSVPVANLGDSYIRFVYRKSIADSLTTYNGKLTLYSNSIRMQTAPVPFANYQFSGWIRLMPGAGASVFNAPMTLAAAFADDSWGMGTQTLNLGQSWQRFSFTGTCPWGFKPGSEIKLAFKCLDGTDRSAYASDWGFDVFALQVSRTDGNYKAVDYAYGDGSEPVFSGFIDKIHGENSFSFGSANVTMECSDDLRVFSETTLATPYQATVNKLKNVLAHFPLDDPAGSVGTIGEASGFVSPPGTLITAGTARTIVYGSPGFIEGTQGGTCFDFKAPAANSGTIINISDPAISALGTTNKGLFGPIDKGFGVDFWTFFTPGAVTRPASGVNHYCAVSLGNTSFLAGAAFSATNDMMFVNTGTEGLKYLMMPKDTLVNQRHLFSVTVGPESSGKRSVSLSIDAGLYYQSYTSTVVAGPWQTVSTLGGVYGDGITYQSQYVGQLSSLTIYNTGEGDSASRYICGAGGSLGNGSYRLSSLCELVHTRYSWTGWKWGYPTAPAAFPKYDFSNTNALGQIQDSAADLQSAFFMTREGRIGFIVKAALDNLKSSGTAIPGNEATFYADQGEGPEPGYGVDLDMSHVYNVVTISRKGGISNTAADPSSVTVYGRRTYNREVKVTQDDYVKQYSRDFVARWSNPEPRISALEWDLSTDDSVAAKILRLDLMGKLTVEEDNAYFGRGYIYRNNYRVEGIDHSVKVEGGIVNWRSSLRVSAIGGAD